jgi:hypothetical protein
MLEDGGGLFQQVVVDVNQSFAHGSSISIALRIGYTPIAAARVVVRGPSVAWTVSFEG